MKIEINCHTCNKLFTRDKSEHNRNERLGRLAFCSRSCCGKSHYIQNFGDKINTDASHLNSANRRDEFTEFRYYVRKAKYRYPDAPDLSPEDVKVQWEKQNGLCIYTGIPLILRKPNGSSKLEKSYQLASLDRIDSKKPYEKGNIQFVSVSINYMKNNMSDTDTRELIEIIRHNKPQ